MLLFQDIQTCFTHSDEVHQSALAYRSDSDVPVVEVVGVLRHGSKIIVTEELVNMLQEVLDRRNKQANERWYTAVIKHQGSDQSVVTYNGPSEPEALATLYVEYGNSTRWAKVVIFDSNSNFVKQYLVYGTEDANE